MKKLLIVSAIVLGTFASVGGASALERFSPDIQTGLKRQLLVVTAIARHATNAVLSLTDNEKPEAEIFCPRFFRFKF